MSLKVEKLAEDVKTMKIEEKIVFGKFTLIKKKKAIVSNDSNGLDRSNSTSMSNNASNNAESENKSKPRKLIKKLVSEKTAEVDLQNQLRAKSDRELKSRPDGKGEKRPKSKKNNKDNEKKRTENSRQSGAIDSAELENLPAPKTTLSLPLRIRIRENYQNTILPLLLQPSTHSIFLSTLESRLSRTLSTDITLHPFGSTVNNLGLITSDIDLTLVSDTTIKRLAKVLRKYYSDVLLIGHARVPIVKFKDKSIEVDINLNRMLGVYNSRLLAAYTFLDCRVKAFIMLIKEFVNRREVGDASKGGLSSYSWTLMGLGYLMTRGVIKNLQGGEEEWIENRLKDKTEMINVGFEKVEEKYYGIEEIDFESDEGVAQLYYDFLYYVGYEYTFENAFSIKDGGISQTNIKKWKNKMVILDPFEVERNCAGSLRHIHDTQRIITACRLELHFLNK